MSTNFPFGIVYVDFSISDTFNESGTVLYTTSDSFSFSGLVDMVKCHNNNEICIISVYETIDDEKDIFRCIYDRQHPTDAADGYGWQWLQGLAKS